MKKLVLIICSVYVSIALVCVSVRFSESNEAYSKQVLELETRIGNLIEENELLYNRLEKYENTDMHYGILFVLSRNSKVDVKIARQIVEEVLECSEKFDLDYRLILAVIWQESRFNVNAKSIKDARGLMQIVPDTQKGIARMLNIDEWDIHDISTNILFGTAYLSKLKRVYSNDIQLMLSAYNGGYVAAKKYRMYLNNELPEDSLSSENVGYIRSVMNVYSKMKSQ